MKVLFPKKDNWDLTTIEQAVLPQTLAVLAKLFQDFDYDSRSLMAVLVATNLYSQTATLPSTAWNGPRQQRLGAEQIWDSMVALAVDNPDQGNLDQHQTNAAVAERLIGFGDYLRLQDVDGLIAYSKEVASFQVSVDNCNKSDVS